VPLSLLPLFPVQVRTCISSPLNSAPPLFLFPFLCRTSRDYVPHMFCSYQNPETLCPPILHFCRMLRRFSCLVFSFPEVTDRTCCCLFPIFLPHLDEFFLLISLLPLFIPLIEFLLPLNIFSSPPPSLVRNFSCRSALASRLAHVFAAFVHERVIHFVPPLGSRPSFSSPKQFAVVSFRGFVPAT